MLLGVMTTNLGNEQGYFTEIAKAAHKRNIEFCRFTPDQINIQSKQMNGEKYNYDENNWIAETLPIPNFIYDRTFHSVTRKENEISDNIKWLKSETTFLGHGLPSKWDIYEALKDHPLLQAFLPPTSKLETAEDVIHKLDDYKQIVLKPTFGSRGSGLYLLSSTESGTMIKTFKKGEKQERLFKSKSQLIKWLARLLQKYSYLCQPYLKLATKEEEPFDLRILLQKNHRNQWVERGRGIRLGQKGLLTANLATGGLMLPIVTFLRQHPHSIPLQAEQTIEHIIRTLPQEVELKFNRLFELGIDLGIDQDGKIWILDINSKPGRKVVELLYPNHIEKLYHAPALYCHFLANHLLKAGE